MIHASTAVYFEDILTNMLVYGTLYTSVGIENAVYFSYKDSVLWESSVMDIVVYMDIRQAESVSAIL